MPYPNLPEGGDTIPQIQHIVVLMMENHSYDNKLGMLGRRDADGFRIGRNGRPLAENPYANGNLQHAFHMPTTCQLAREPSQTWLNSHIQFDKGRNDGFVESDSGPVAMGYWDRADQPFYYSMAQVFPIADRYFASLLGQTFPNRRYLISATSIGMINDTTPTLADYPANGTIFDRLDAAGITWRDYFSTLPTTELYPQLYFKNVGTKVVPITAFFDDAAAGSLPGFCLVEPNYETQSEEDPQNIAAGEQFAAQVINAVIAGPGWKNTPLVWTYDEGGGYYDHVGPPAALAPDDIPQRFSAASPPTTASPNTASVFPPRLSRRGHGQTTSRTRSSTTPASWRFLTCRPWYRLPGVAVCRPAGIRPVSEAIRVPGRIFPDPVELQALTDIRWRSRRCVA